MLSAGACWRVMIRNRMDGWTNIDVKKDLREAEEYRVTT